MLQQLGSLAMLCLLIGIVPAIMAMGYAAWPSESKLALMRPLSLASLFAGLAGFQIGAINAIHFWVVNDGDKVGGLLVGFSEAMVSLFVSFGSLTLAWLLVAVGMRRQAS
jgi:hypothetical protein